VGRFCPPGSGYGSTDLTGSGFNPDPKYWFFKLLSIAARGPVRTFRHAAAATQEPAHHAQGADHQQEEDVQVVTHPPLSLPPLCTVLKIAVLRIRDVYPGSKNGIKR
jgi:hypothetical protein